MRYGRRYLEELAVLAGLLPQITVLVTIMNGRDDRVVPLANAEERVEYASAVLDSITRYRS